MGALGLGRRPSGIATRFDTMSQARESSVLSQGHPTLSPKPLGRHALSVECLKPWTVV